MPFLYNDPNDIHTVSAKNLHWAFMPVSGNTYRIVSTNNLELDGNDNDDWFQHDKVHKTPFMWAQVPAAINHHWKLGMCVALYSMRTSCATAFAFSTRLPY